jgi:hypothetical protein
MGYSGQRKRAPQPPHSHSTPPDEGVSRGEGNLPTPVHGELCSEETRVLDSLLPPSHQHSCHVTVAGIHKEGDTHLGWVTILGRG